MGKEDIKLAGVREEDPEGRVQWRKVIGCDRTLNRGTIEKYIVPWSL